MNPERTEGKLPDLPNRPRWSAVAVAALIILSAVVACNKVWTYDVFWHLKRGQWMLENRQVLDQPLVAIALGVEHQALLHQLQLMHQEHQDEAQ